MFNCIFNKLEKKLKEPTFWNGTSINKFHWGGLVLGMSSGFVMSRVVKFKIG
jgi:hypothetical protein